VRKGKKRRKREGTGLGVLSSSRLKRNGSLEKEKKAGRGSKAVAGWEKWRAIATSDKGRDGSDYLERMSKLEA